tara:strand:+ start:2031 stop:2201 length:171 start_codon:yes stop_codon:yes gene_type:complete
MSIENLIDNIKNGENVKAGKDFEALMTGKISDALDAKKIELASTMQDRVAAKKEEE